MKNNLPNKLTVLRIILTFVVIGLLVFPYAEVGIAVTTYDIGGVSLKLNYAIAGLIYLLVLLILLMVILLDVGIWLLIWVRC